jgi:hypothetical protein
MKTLLTNTLAILIVAPIGFVGVATLAYAQAHGFIFAIPAIPLCIASLFLGLTLADKFVSKFEK